MVYIPQYSFFVPSALLGGSYDTSQLDIGKAKLNTCHVAQICRHLFFFMDIRRIHGSVYTVKGLNNVVSCSFRQHGLIKCHNSRSSDHTVKLRNSTQNHKKNSMGWDHLPLFVQLARPQRSTPNILKLLLLS